MTTALHLPLLELNEGDKVECINCGSHGKVAEIFTPKSTRHSRCPVRPRYRIVCHCGSSWHFRNQLRPI